MLIKSLTTSESKLHKWVQCERVTYRQAAGNGGSLAPNSEIMIHQPLGAAEGQATDILIHAKHIEQTRAKLNRILSENTGKPLETIEKDTERDNFLTAQEAAEYGLIDKVIERK